jgi:hypothetical protein
MVVLIVMVMIFTAILVAADAFLARIRYERLRKMPIYMTKDQIDTFEYTARRLDFEPYKTYHEIDRKRIVEVPDDSPLLKHPSKIVWTGDTFQPFKSYLPPDPILQADERIFMIQEFEDEEDESGLE